MHRQTKHVKQSSDSGRASRPKRRRWGDRTETSTGRLACVPSQPAGSPLAVNPAVRSSFTAHSSLRQTCDHVCLRPGFKKHSKLKFVSNHFFWWRPRHMFCQEMDTQVWIDTKVFRRYSSLGSRGRLRAVCAKAFYFQRTTLHLHVPMHVFARD